ncbi:hypothetical protein CEXT_51891 [Caerostris extrusa]|uniref:Uncharacterized protein n=1 Tax=Caerostris extrusa TaxID=172846 RepID=A0AAV4PRS8_CAEEX|nr:hypothetical protein CEXT_51891 [Caerostris extrusa]
MMNLCRANVDFPLRSGIIRATVATSADASGIVDAEVVMAMNKTEIMKKKEEKKLKAVPVMMNLCKANVDFSPWSGIIRAMEATSADASGTSTQKRPWQ